jgi:adenylate cyclase
LKNIAEPMRVYSLQVGKAAGPKPTPPPEPARLALPDKPSIAVLPFQNMSGDQSQEYFADGMVEDIITGLSRIKWLFVIARNSSFVYKGKAVDIRQVGRELGVRYVLGGGVRKAGNRLRITGQLIEAETGAHLWADKFDGTLEDVFDFQDQITERVVGIVEPSLQRSEIERSRRKHPDRLGAYDLYLRALPHLTSVQVADARIAAGYLTEALEIDPNYIAAHARLAHCHEIFFENGFDEADKIASLRHARFVAASDTNDATALAVAAFMINILTREQEAALSATERALALNPSCATALYFGALMYGMAARPAEAIGAANRALRLSPFDPSIFQAHLALGLAAIAEARYDEAASHMAKAVQANSRFGALNFFHAEALALAGRLEEAAPIARRGMEMVPFTRIGMYSAMGGASTLVDKLIEGARLLGLPE